jgi:predicted Zn-dependent protease
MRDRQFSAASAMYAKAVKYAPNDPIILAGMGRAQLTAGQYKSAVKTLSKARDRDFRNASLLRDLAQAYAKTKNLPMASLVTAERYALQGKLKDAKLHATRAAGQLPRGSPSWQRAQDILSFK